MVVDRGHVLSLWQSAFIEPARTLEVKNTAGLLIGFREKYYDPVEKATGIPWYVVGALDFREESFDHFAYLGNGDLLSRPTIHVPRGRGPFSSWYAGAIDALHYDGLDSLDPADHWNIVTALIKTEKYNGMGYFKHGLPSPYVWGATNIQKAGKYTSDGHWSPETWDKQLGCAAIWLGLKQFYNVDLSEA